MVKRLPQYWVLLLLVVLMPMGPQVLPVGVENSRQFSIYWPRLDSMPLQEVAMVLILMQAMEIIRSSIQRRITALN